MARMRLPFALALLVAAGCAAASPDPRIVGRWEGLDSTGRCSGFVFDAAGKVVAFVSRGEVLIPDPKRASAMRFMTDTASKPARIDLVMTDAAGAEQRRLLAIYRFPTQNSFELRTYYNDDRPSGFGPDQDAKSVVLQRLTTTNQKLVCRISERPPKAR